MSLIIGSGITVGSGIRTTFPLVTDGLLLNFDAATYIGQSTGSQQNVAGSNDNIGFFPYGWSSAPPTGFGNVQPGWVCVQTGAVVTVVDSVSHTITTIGTPFTSGSAYTFIGNWVDSVSGVSATPSNNPVWSSDNGGTFVLDAPSIQYFTVPWPTFQPTYTLDIWFNFTANQIYSSPCLISDDFSGPFNFTINAAGNYLQTGWYTTNWNGQYATNNVPTELTHDGSTWYNIIMAVGESEYKDYINGSVSYAPGDFGPGGSAPENSGQRHQFYIGKRWDNVDTVNAKMAVVNVYDRALTDEEANQNFKHYKSRFGL